MMYIFNFVTFYKILYLLLGYLYCHKLYNIKDKQILLRIYLILLVYNNSAVSSFFNRNTISSLIVMQNYSKSISMYKSDLQYGEILVRSYRYMSRMFVHHWKMKLLNIKSNVSSLTESKSAAARLLVYLYM